MQYQYVAELPSLVERKIVNARRHPQLPLTIYNYTVLGQMTPISEWTETMKDCRGLILDDSGEIVGRPFRKFWNYEQVQDRIPDERFQVFEKLDGSLGIVCYYAGERIVATRGSFESEQANWLRHWLDQKHDDFYPSGETWLFEIIYPSNRIVVDYGDRKEAVLLSVMAPDGYEMLDYFKGSSRFTKARIFDGLSDFADINSNPAFAGEEGFVVRWESGFRAKAKLEEYKRLHRLVTQCSTRTIWELLRNGSGVQELLDRVPVEFGAWVNQAVSEIRKAAESARDNADTLYGLRPPCDTRKEFALWATKQPNPSLLFSLLDGRDITDACWRLAEPKWATPFRKDIDV